MDVDLLIDLAISDSNLQPKEWKDQNGIRTFRPVMVSDEDKHRPRRANFSPEEHAWLVENYQYLGADECSRRLGRTVASIRIHVVRHGIKSPRQADGYISANKVAKILGKDVHGISNMMQMGIMPSEQMPYDYLGVTSRWIKTDEFEKWLIVPEHWVYFRVDRIVHPYIRHLVQQAQEQWGDEWIDTTEVAKLWGTDVKSALIFIKRKNIPAIRVVGKDRVKDPKWAYWYMRRSVAESTVYQKRRKRTQGSCG